MLSSTDTRALLLDAAEDAAHYPSSHNAQPCVLCGAQSADMQAALAAALPATAEARAFALVALDPTRCLRALPAHRVEMILSVGTYLESLAAALGARGVGTRVGWLTGADGKVDSGIARLLTDGLEPIAALVLEGTIDASLRVRAERRRALLARRRTDRGPFDPEPLDGRVISALRDATSIAFPAEPDRTVAAMILDPVAKRAAARLLRSRGAIDFLHPAAWKETYRHIHFTGTSEDGLPVDALLARRVSGPGRRALSVLLSPGVMRAAGRLGLAQSLATEASHAIEAAPLLIYLHFRDAAPSVAAQVQAGARLQAMWLEAAAHGLALHPFSVLVQHDDLRAELARCLEADGRGFFFARAGRPLAEAPRAPRRAKPREHLRVV